MMEEHEKMVAYRLDRANQAIAEAKFLIREKHLHTAVNRLYYACFYTVSALLITKEISVKRHSAAIQLFGLHFIGPGLISKESGRFYSQMLELRQESDYEYFIEFEKEEIEALVPQAEALINEITSFLQHR